MRAIVRSIGEVSIVEIVGRFSCAAGLPVAERHVRELLASGRRRFLLDLGRVTYIDSGGIGDLLASHAAARESGAAVKVVAPLGRVHDLFRIIGFERGIETFPSQLAALRSFAADSAVAARPAPVIFSEETDGKAP